MLVASQRSLHYAPIFRLLLKVAVNGTHQCDFPNFCEPSWLNIFTKTKWSADAKITLGFRAKCRDHGLNGVWNMEYGVWNMEYRVWSTQ